MARLDMIGLIAAKMVNARKVSHSMPQMTDKSRHDR